MFEVDPERTWVDPSAGTISTLVQSLNTPLVAAGPHPAEQVQSFIVTRQATGGGAFEVFVFFHLTESNQAVLYHWDGGPVPPPQLQYVQDEALSFCESMGFMMDNLTVPGLNTPDQRSTFLSNLPPFVQDLSTIVRETSQEDESAAKKSVDPLEEFQKAKAAMQESGQATTRDFVAAQPHDDEPPLVGGFDPGAAAVPGGDGEMQIEITEIEGLELIPDGAAPADPPLVRGKASVTIDGDDDNAKTSLYSGPGATSPPSADDEPPLVVGTHAAKLGHGEALRGDREIDLDSMLADVPESSNGAAKSGEDLSSELDSILDGVESSKAGKKKPAAAPAPAPKSSPRINAPPPAAPSKPAAAAPPPKPAAPPPPAPDDLDLDIDITMEPGGAADALAALGDEEPMSLDTAPGGPGTPAPQTLNIESLLGGDDAEPAPAPAPVKPASPPAVRPSVDTAWESSYHAPPLKAATGGKPNGNGATQIGGHNGAGAALDIATDDLARLLAML